MNSRGTRLARGWVVGVFATALAALSHAVAGGGTPSGLALVVGIVFGGMLSTFALSSRPSLPRLAIAVAGTQFAFHLAFSTLGAAAPVAADHTHGMLTMAAPVMTAHAHTGAPAMWLGHAVAGLVTFALLRGAEHSAWRVLTEFARLVVSPFRLVSAIPVPVRRSPVVSTSPARLTSRLLDPAVSRRGPPLSAAF